ncbi:MAG TPA: PEGA domain-containing protein, partial [Phycisphaerae bacterium]|nr:PEGA domain-containing protein [Phycisphaerae bacterium]
MTRPSARRGSASPLVSIASLLATLLLLGGCVERKLRIRTDPPGALVTINDEQVGVTPLEVTFLWYGDYELVLRKSGFETLRTHSRANAPWWQFPPFGLVAETLVPT